MSLLTMFLEYPFMQRALFACAILSFSAPPIGVFLVLKRITLTADAISHALLPGVAIMFLIYGYSYVAMSAGGILAGLCVLTLTVFVSSSTHRQAIYNESNIAVFYMISLALGVILISHHGTMVDLVHVLFGQLLFVNKTLLILLASIGTLTLLSLALFYRLFVVSCFDPVFVKTCVRRDELCLVLFYALCVLNLVAGFLALGTLLAVGLMVIPAICAFLWSRQLSVIIVLSVVFALAASVVGLIVAFAANLAPSPTIILICGLIYCASIAIRRWQN